MLFPVLAHGQSKQYDMSFVPDLWYNQVDGMRLGIRLSGEMEDTYKDGPHRLDAGLWLGTKLPERPVSYYISFTEPLKGLSSFGSEANIELKSSIRTGYSMHEFSFNKRWQPGFNELKYRELSLSFSQEKLIDNAYRPYPQLWQNSWKSLVGLNVALSDVNGLGRFLLNSTLTQNVHSKEGFTTGDMEIKQNIPLGSGFKLKIRGYAGYSSEDTAPEYLFGTSYRQPIEWLQNGIMRAKGTLPQSLLNDGVFQLAGGANLRGYAQQDFEALAQGSTFQYTMVTSANVEVVFPNPVNKLLNNSLAGDFVELNSYLFGDIGRLSRDNYPNTSGISTDVRDVKADAGIGLQFSLNIPDYLGKDRGFAIRYEVPLWISDPETGEKSFGFRNLIGIGAVISL